MRQVPLPVWSHLPAHGRDRRALRYSHVGDHDEEEEAERIGGRKSFAERPQLADSGSEIDQR